MQGDRFEWDDDKARINLSDHRVSFEIAQLVFDDANGVDDLDDREDYGEERSNRSGLVQGKLIRVCYTYRDNHIRIISARKATKREHKAYFER
jgi:uncharacterized protein